MILKKLRPHAPVKPMGAFFFVTITHEKTPSKNFGEDFF